MSLDYLRSLYSFDGQAAIVTGGTGVLGRGARRLLRRPSPTSTRALTRVAGYGAAKGAVENLTRSLAVELGRRHRDSIHVNAIAPGCGARFVNGMWWWLTVASARSAVSE